MMDIEKVLERDGFYVGTPVGDSMWPLLHGRVDSVVLRKESEPRKYDVMLYRRANGQLVLHRYYGRDRKGRRLFAGDNQTRFERQTEDAEILAVMIAYYKGEKKYYVDQYPNRLYDIFWVRLFFPRVPVIYIRSLVKKIKKSRNRRKSAEKAD